MSFDTAGLHPLILRNLHQMGYAEPRPIQRAVLAPAAQGRDVIGLAETGMGKTAAFIAPVAHALISERPPQRKGRPIEPRTRLRALVLCPTRELAQQVAREAGRIMQGSVLRTACAYGKVAMSPQAQAIARGVDLLVATPGRVRELLDAGALSLAYIRHVIIDEADRMLDMGFLPQVDAILQGMPEQRQTMLFSATMPGEVEALAQRFLRDPVRIDAGGAGVPAGHIQQHLLPVDDREKVPLLLHLLTTEPKRRGVLVFCGTKRRVGWVATALERNGLKVGALHGDRSQAQREKALSRFADGELHVLVASDVAARGLHVPAVKTVVNYDVPGTPEEYVHRVGRAGHGGGTFAEAFTFLSQEQRDRWRAVLDSLGVEVYAETLPGFETKAVKRQTSKRQTKAAGKAGAVRTGKGGKRSAASPGRSRKSRPIKPGQKPGSGVVRRGGA